MNNSQYFQKLPQSIVHPSNDTLTEFALIDKFKSIPYWLLKAVTFTSNSIAITDILI